MCNVSYLRYSLGSFNRSAASLVNFVWLPSFITITEVPNAYETERESHNHNGSDQEM